MPFVVDSGVGRGMGVLDGDLHRPKEKRRYWGCFAPIGLNGIFLIKTEMYSTRAFKVHNISVRTIYRWKWLFVGSGRCS